MELLPITLSVIAFLAAFILAGWLIGRGTGLEKFRYFVATFLKEPATLKTWGLVAAAPVVCGLLSGTLVKMSDGSWPNDASTAALRIQFFLWVAVGLLLLLAIVLGALGAVTFKGQGPGGVSFQLNQDPNTGAQNVSGTGPAPPQPPKPTSEQPE